MARRALISLIALTALCAVPLACGDDDGTDDVTTDSQAVQQETDSTEPGGEGESGGDAGSDGSFQLTTMEFRLTTADDSVTVQGTASECADPGETTLTTEFSDGTNTVLVSATDGTGTVTIPGVFEGMVEDMSVGDTGIVSIIGRGSIADDSATPTTFEVIGICP
ncbi:MAG: hypothetical protein GY812_05135 [Actinomycetia bacterium]|nr:hypothetical protein [Actinomycetes bacterium]